MHKNTWFGSWVEQIPKLRADALAIFQAGLKAADPRAAILRVLRREGNVLQVLDHRYDLAGTRVFVIGAGKASAPMAQAVEHVLADHIDRGLITVKYGYTAPLERIKLKEAGHPLPDANGVQATREIVNLLSDLTPDDLVVCLISGGGSALLELPAGGVSLDDLRALTEELLRSGATINELNTLRKHLSQVKGGQLARLAQPAKVISLILSDVLSSPLDVIASGPTAPDSTTFRDALGVVDKYGLRDRIPTSILQHLQRGVGGEIPDTPKADDPLFARVLNVIVADNSIACEAAAAAARNLGYETRLISTTVQGEAREVGIQLAQQAKQVAAHERDRTCLVAGGETTVTLRGHGTGGRSQELALAAAIELAGANQIVVLSAGTDGTDGPTDAAGAIADGTTAARAERRGLDMRAFLEDNDSYHFFRELGDLIVTGPTNTNVNDITVCLVGKEHDDTVE